MWDGQVWKLPNPGDGDLRKTDNFQNLVKVHEKFRSEHPEFEETSVECK